MTTRKYQSRAQQTTLASALAANATTMTVNSGSTLAVSAIPNGQTYTVVIDPDTSLEEIVDITNWSSGNSFTIARGVDGSSDVAHSAGAVVRHMAIGRDYRESNTHIEAGTAVHGLGAGVAVVGDTSTQTLTNKTINAANNTITGITSAMITDGTIVNADINASAAIAYSKLALTGTIISGDIANDTIVNADINTAAAIAATKIAGTAVTQADTGTVSGTMIADGAVTNAKITGTISRSKIGQPFANENMNGYRIVSLNNPVDTNDAANKNYVDTAISNLIGGAPGTLDTLDEIAAALNDTANFADTVVLKTGSTMSGPLAMGTNKVTGLGTPTTSTDAATKGYVDTVTVAPSNLTGPITSVGSATSVAAQTGTGSTFVMNTSPTLVTPALGVATATSVNGTTIPSTKTLVVTTDKLNVLAATTSAELRAMIPDETGTGVLVFGTSPTISDPKIAQLTPTVTSTNYTFGTADQGKYILADNSSAQVYNIPTNASAAFAVGSSIDLVQAGAGQVTIQASSSGTTTVYSVGATAAAPKTRARYSAVTLKKVATDTWHVIGDIV
jgi:hypothetical protein